MKSIIDYIVENYSNLISTISLPITIIILLRERKNRLIKALNEISLIVLERIINEEKLSIEFLEGVKNSILQRKKIDNRRIQNYEIMDNLFLLIEETPFVKRRKKSTYFEIIEKAKKNTFFQNRKVTDIDFLLARTLTVATIIFSVIYILAKENIAIDKWLIPIAYVLLGIFIVLISLIITIIVVVYHKRDHVEGVFKVKNSSYRYLKIAAEQELIFQDRTKSKQLVLENQGIKSRSNKICVDTGPGPFGTEFLMSRRFQYHEQIDLIFSNSEQNIKIQYTLKKRSLVNGIHKFDVLDISILKGDEALITLSKLVNSDDENSYATGKNFDNYSLIHEEKKGQESHRQLLKVANNNYLIITDSDCKILKFSDGNVEWKLIASLHQN